MDIDENKLSQFSEWCKKNNLQVNEVIHKLISACLAENPLILKLLLTSENNQDIFRQEVELIIKECLAEIIPRLEKLESQYLSNVNEKESRQSPLPLTSIHPLEKRVYLPRQEVWQRLKNTDYVKYSGYDSFLKAKGDEFDHYGIFFDSETKRFYTLNNSI